MNVSRFVMPFFRFKSIPSMRLATRRRPCALSALHTSCNSIRSSWRNAKTERGTSGALSIDSDPSHVTIHHKNLHPRDTSFGTRRNCAKANAPSICRSRQILWPIARAISPLRFADALAIDARWSNSICQHSRSATPGRFPAWLRALRHCSCRFRRRIIRQLVTTTTMANRAFSRAGTHRRQSFAYCAHCAPTATVGNRREPPFI